MNFFPVFSYHVERTKETFEHLGDTNRELRVHSVLLCVSILLFTDINMVFMTRMLQEKYDMKK